MEEFSKEELLILLIEECSEVIQAATKCLRFGYDADHNVGYGRNDIKLSQECGDLQAIINELPLIRSEFERTQLAKIKKAKEAQRLYGKK